LLYVARTPEKVGKGVMKMKKGVCLSMVFLLLLGWMVLPSPGPAGEPRAPRMVIIDPAHGGNDKGVKLSDQEYEKDLTLKIALELQKELQASENIRVRLTRSSDSEMAKAERNKAVREARADICISLHVNAGFGKTAAGYEVYFPGFNAPQGKTDGAAEILKDMTKNKYLNDSVALAQSIMTNLGKAFARKGRGLRDAPVPLLDGLSLPAVVVELGFGTNPEDKKTLTNAEGRRAIVQALSRGIREYFKKAKPV